MTKLDEIENLLKAVKTANAEDKESDFDNVDGCIKSYIAYHNEAVNQGWAVKMARYRLDDDRFADYVNALHRTRKSLHENMVAKTILLNKICEKYELPKIYSGPLDEIKGREDDDTRYGVAEFGERLCRDFFHSTYETTITKRQMAAYEKHAENVKNRADAWSMMESMMEKMNAQNEMGSLPEDDFERAINEMSAPSSEENNLK